jgi:hypothetical protein
MKKLAALTMLAIAGVTLAGTASAEAVQGPDYRRLVQYSAPDSPPVATAAVYLVRGVNYPVDYQMRLWGRNMTTGEWLVIGRILPSPYGDVAVDSNGNRYPALRVQ